MVTPEKRELKFQEILHLLLLISSGLSIGLLLWQIFHPDLLRPLFDRAAPVGTEGEILIWMVGTAGLSVLVFTLLPHGLQRSVLGGHGSRGYGRVGFSDFYVERIDEKT